MLNSTRFLFIGHNFSPELTGVGKYNGEMVEWLIRNGHDCTVVTTFPYYPHWKLQAPYKNIWYKKEVVSVTGTDKKFVVYRCPLYIPKIPSGKNRILHDLSFWLSILLLILKLILFNKGYDYIITISPPFHLGFLSRLYRKIRGGKLIYHIQDLQIDAAQGLNMLNGARLFNLLYKAEKVMLTGSDFVSSISYGMIERIKLKVNRPVIFFPNWVKTSNFFPINDKSLLKNKWGYDGDQFICLYSGSIGKKQGLENVIFAAEVLRNESKIQFIICGTGPFKKSLQQLVFDKQLENVTFLPLQNEEKFNDFLNMADVHLIMQKANVSDFVMPSKLFTILSTGGVSIITANKNSSLYEFVEKSDVGIVIPPDDHLELAKTIKDLPNFNISAKRENARRFALKYLNIDIIMNQFVKDICVTSDFKTEV